MTCQVCDKSTNNTKTCSVKCGMIYRYLHPKGYNKLQIQDILKKTEFISNLSIKARLYAYKNNITKMPTCKNCGKEHFRFRDNLKDTCSVKCSKELRLKEKKK